ncbi:MAG: MXAN_2562 family outer membrane beta-barrel protein [Myxococcota bacterium]
MSTTSLLAAAALATATAAPEPPPPPSPPPSGDEVSAVEDDQTAETEAEVAEAGEADVPPAPAMPRTPGSIPAEGETKSPPSQKTLDRESPLAQPDTRPRDRAGRLGSPQRFALEVKMGPFLPDIDRDYEGTGLGPYATIFGETDDAGEATDRPRAFPMPVVAFDWQFLYLAGPLGIGAQLGIFRDSADAIITAPTDPDSLRSEADTVTFTVLPLAILLSYRFSLLADRFRVPLVPYAKGGLAYSLFWSKGGSGNLSRNSRDEAAIGAVPGWQVNLGGMFRLDIIEPGTAKKLDNLTGINHTYIFGEYQLSRVDNFGIGQAISLGDSTWFAGLAIEF